MKKIAVMIGIAVFVVLCPRSTLAQQRDANTNLDVYTNLKVLPKDVSRRELVNAMLEHLRGLGLRRNRNEGCLYCHVGEFGQPTDTWDFASDEKPAKQKARVMMGMVAAINGQHLTELPEASRPPMRVTATPATPVGPTLGRWPTSSCRPTTKLAWTPQPHDTGSYTSVTTLLTHTTFA